MAELKFFKGALTEEALAKVTLGSIWFNTEKKTINVYSEIAEGENGWVPFAGELKDIKWESEKLVISKYDGSSVELDFSAVATDADVEALAATVAANKTAAETGIGQAKDAAKAADDKAVAAQGTIDAYVESNDARVKDVEDDLAGYKETNDAAVEGVGNKVTALEGVVYSNENKTGLVDKVAELEGLFSGTEGSSVSEMISSAVETLEQTIQGKLDAKVDSETYATDKKALEDADAALEQALSTEKGRAEAAEEANANAIAAEKARVDALVGAKDGDGNFVDAGKSVREIAVEELAAQLIPENAAESLDTLKELADWIQAHPEDASAMNSAIEANAAAIEVLNGEGEGSVKKAVADAKTEIYAEIESNEEVTAEALNDLNTREGELRGRVETLEAVGAGDRLTAVETAVTTTLPNAITAAQSAAEAKAAELATAAQTGAEATAQAALEAAIAAEVTRSNKYADDAVAVEAAKVAKNTQDIEALQTKVNEGLSWAYFA